MKSGVAPKSDRRIDIIPWTITIRCAMARSPRASASTRQPRGSKGGQLDRRNEAAGHDRDCAGWGRDAVTRYAASAPQLTTGLTCDTTTTLYLRTKPAKQQ
eukprot:4876119-Prorocentrum_lima.AAC.1